MSSESKYRFKFSIWSFAFSAELNPSLKVELSNSWERALPPWSKCCDLVSSLLKGKFLHKLWRVLTEICLWCCQSKNAIALFCSCFQPNCVLMYNAGQILWKPSVLPWSPCTPHQWRQGSYCCPWCPHKGKDNSWAGEQSDENWAREWLAEFIATTEFRGMQRLKKNLSPLFCPRSRCKTHPPFCTDFLVPVQCLLNSEKHFAWKKEGIEEASWNVVLPKF